MNTNPNPLTSAAPRRSFLKWLTALVSAAAAAVLAVPGVGYLAGA